MQSHTVDFAASWQPWLKLATIEQALAEQAVPARALVHLVLPDGATTAAARWPGITYTKAELNRATSALITW